MSIPFRSDPLEELSIPDGTTVEEHDVVTDGDVFVGGQSTIELGVRGHNVVAGERVRFGGTIEAEGDCRLDMWCEVDGNVLVGQDAYLGERVHIAGQLMVSGDLDIGDDVDVDEGFEANGWIVIRNPMPTVVFFFVYLSHLLRIGEEEEAGRVADEMLTDEDGGAEPLSIPRGSRVSDDAWRVSTPAVVGDGCRLHGNIRAQSVEMGADNELFGSLRAQDDVTVGEGTVIHGDVTTRGGDVLIADRAVIKGDVSGEDVTIRANADVDGSIRARGETRIGPSQHEAETETVDVADPVARTDGANDDPGETNDDANEMADDGAETTGDPDGMTDADETTNDPDETTNDPDETTDETNEEAGDANEDVGNTDGAAGDTDGATGDSDGTTDGVEADTPADTEGQPSP